MKDVYDNIELKSGSTNAGISKIQIVPKQWLNTDIAIDFATGSVVNAISLISGRSLHELVFAPLTYDFEEKPKSSKSGQVISVSISGLINDLDAPTLQVLETFRMNELVVIATDRNRRKRIVGSKEYGMLFSFDNKQSNSPNGNLRAQITMNFDSEFYPPFYMV